jgi:host factor-I protein
VGKVTQKAAFLAHAGCREGWMGKSQVNLQDIFLNQMRKEKIPVTMYLVNGARLTGMIKGFDNFVILMKQENQQLVYKHAISTIIPEKPVELLEGVEARKEAEQEQGAVQG